MAIFPRGKIYWYKFYFAGQLIRESSKSTSKTVAKNAENQRRRELEQGFNNVQTRREIRIRQLRDVAEDYLGDYRLRFRGVTFAEYAIGHVVRHLGEKLLIDIDETTVQTYQTARLKEQASPKSINEEVRFLLTMMGESGDVIRVRLRKKKKLKLPTRRKIGKAYEPEETQRMGDVSRNSRSPHIQLALTLALNAGMRDAEIKSLTWGQIHLDKGYLQVGKSKTAAGEGRTIPINSVLRQAILEHRVQYEKKFKCIADEWYVFPFGKSRPSDPTRPVTTLKTAWKNVRKNAKVTGRWHDHRHTLITQCYRGVTEEKAIGRFAWSHPWSIHWITSVGRTRTAFARACTEKQSHRISRTLNCLLCKAFQTALGLLFSRLATSSTEYFVSSSRASSSSSGCHRRLSVSALIPYLITNRQHS